ncbi:hypothetical protein BaRGS_00005478 [Batillaria attramentaria]|uniref:Uncharacterized protein n=1 Tax=Batillaria attramentaria TaxID=370345 RepID=A0ABD0LV15_9CAEN
MAQNECSMADTAKNGNSHVSCVVLRPLSDARVETLVHRAKYIPYSASPPRPRRRTSVTDGADKLCVLAVARLAPFHSFGFITITSVLATAPPPPPSFHSSFLAGGSVPKLPPLTAG